MVDKVAWLSAPLTSHQHENISKVKSSYDDFFRNIKFRKGWDVPLISHEEVDPLFEAAAELTVRIRSYLDDISPGFKMRIQGGSSQEFLWEIDYQPKERPKEFLKGLVHATFRDAKGYVEGLTGEDIDEFIELFSHIREPEKSAWDPEQIQTEMKKLQKEIEKISSISSNVDSEVKENHARKATNHIDFAYRHLNALRLIIENEAIEAENERKREEKRMEQERKEKERAERRKEEERKREEEKKKEEEKQKQEQEKRAKAEERAKEVERRKKEEKERERDRKEADLDDWNRRFQAINSSLLSLMSSGSVGDVDDANFQRLQLMNMELINLIQDFISTCKIYGRIIISERFIDTSRKTIRPSIMGGVAGGEKYIVNNVLFKFAVDTNNMFKGDDYAAAKVAGHELKGLMAYSNLKLPNLCLPLMSLLDFNGFRLIAMSLIPVNKTTLRYGTADAGKTIFCEEPLVGVMQDCGERLNLQPHYVKCVDGEDRLLYSAADIEGHFGTDNRMYLLDFSRTFPPTYPERSIHNGHLYRLLRQEYVKSFSVPLCPDAYSGFLYSDPNKRKYNTNVRAATQYLCDTLIKDTYRKLTAMFFDASMRGQARNFSLSEHFHRDGINIRYIGLMIRERREANNRDLIFCTILALEALSRVAKNELRRRLREKQRELKVTVSAPYRLVIVHFLNQLFGSVEANNSQGLWALITKRLEDLFYLRGEDIVSLVHEHFPPAERKMVSNTSMSMGRLMEPEQLQHDDSKLAIRKLLEASIPNGQNSNFDGIYFVLKRLESAGGIELNATLWEKLTCGSKNEWNSVTPFEVLDLKKQRMQVKQTNIISTSAGNFYYTKGLEASKIGSMGEALSLTKVAEHKYRQALKSDPTDPHILASYAQCRSMVMALQKSGGKSMANIIFSMYDAEVEMTDSYFSRALEASQQLPPSDLSYLLLLYAKFLVRCSRMNRAEDFFLRSLEAHPNNVRCLRTYGRFLNDVLQHYESCELFLARGGKANLLKEDQL
mmetsp:Transcript_5907/g.7764  ORF Transcript_5907/g.7764 Transcript_5907/m.7764 type:complete len:1006 (-) Transcript_5907:86-3103(-)